MVAESGLGTLIKNVSNVVTLRNIGDTANIKLSDNSSQVPSTHTTATTAIHGVGASTIDSVANRDTAISTHAALTATHGATGAVVGTTNSQALTNKTLNDSTNTITCNAGGNLLSALTPTFLNWTTSPGTNADIANELTNTLTTSGVSAAAGLPVILYDLGSSLRVSVSFMMIGSTCALTISDDDIAYYDQTQGIGSGFGITVNVKARYLKFMFANSQTYTNIKLRAYKL